MINLSDIVTDPDFAQSFTVYRSTGEFGAGGWIQGTEEAIPMFGVVSVISQKELDMLPEGDRVKGAMVFHTTQPLYVTHNDLNRGVSDQIELNGERYKIFNVWPYGDYGFYKAAASRVKGS